MVSLNPDQFKLDLGSNYHNREHDAALSKSYHESLSPVSIGKTLPGVGQPDPGYYGQPTSRARQMALPGMHMSVADHLRALSERTGKVADIWTGGGEHQLTLKDPEPPTRWAPYSHLQWNANRSEHPLPGSHAASTPSGEIQMIKSEQPGDASAMLSTAEALAHEHGYTFPKHSEDRTSAGVRWSQNQMAKRGEKVW